MSVAPSKTMRFRCLLNDADRVQIVKVTFGDKPLSDIKESICQFFNIPPNSIDKMQYDPFGDHIMQDIVDDRVVLQIVDGDVVHVSTSRPVATPMVPAGGGAVAQGPEQVTPEKVSKKRKVEETNKEGPQKNFNGETFFDLGNKRRVTVQKYKGKLQVQVREYYDAGGEMKPGKVGIALKPEHFEVIVANAEAIRKAVDELK